MSKKSILITMTYMHIGGAERSLLGLLETIDYTQYEVDLFLFSHQGAYLPMIPDKVNLLPEIREYNVLTTPLNELKQNDKKAYWKKKIAVTLARILYALKGNKCSENGVTLCCEKLLVPGLPRINTKRYDLGISYMAYHSILKEKAYCQKTIGWFHNDYSVVNPLKILDARMWHRMDYIALVSADCRNTFIQVYPHLRKKAIVIENILSSRQIFNQAEAEFETDGCLLNEPFILTLGRLTAQKNYPRAIEACSILKERNCNVKWVVLGSGELKNEIERCVKSFNVEDCFILLGVTDNPYPYIKSCTIYAQPSDFEGKSVAVREAQILGKPVLITNYETAPSQVENGVDGIIVDKTPEAVAEGIKRLLSDAAMRNQLSQNCLQRDYTNAMEIEKVYELIN